MQDYLRHYNMRLTALSPIHVGDGTQIGKKEYIQMGMRKPVIVPDMNKMFQTLSMLKRDTAYARFMLEDNRQGLGQWLTEQRIPETYITKWKRYSMDPGDAFVRQGNSRRSATPKGIMSFVKDAYERPYVPGSTLKGMLRNALLCWRIHENSGQYKREKEALRQASDNGKKGKSYLAREIQELESAVFHTLNCDKKHKSSAVNSIMSGFIVSDSEPLQEKQLMLAQKIDYTLQGEEKPLPILREALRPGSQIDFEVTIDSEICDVTIEEIFAALDYLNQVSYEYFYRHFRRGSTAEGTVWIGGGTGFLSKTMLYPVYGDDALRLTDSVFYATIGKNYSLHKHFRDVTNGVAPHVCKCTRYQGKLYDMGMGKIELLA